MSAAHLGTEHLSVHYALQDSERRAKELASVRISGTMFSISELRNVLEYFNEMNLMLSRNFWLNNLVKLFRSPKAERVHSPPFVSSEALSPHSRG